MGRPVRSGVENLPRVLAGLLVPIAGILLLTFYFSDRPAATDETGAGSAARKRGGGGSGRSGPDFAGGG